MSKNDDPCASKASLSISPKRIPPCLFRPLMGCLVKELMGPIARTWLLSLTCSKKEVVQGSYVFFELISDQRKGKHSQERSEKMTAGETV
jgi:hypothetical protein